MSTRTTLLQQDNKPHSQKLNITPIHMGHREGLNYDGTEALLEYGEGDHHRRAFSTSIFCLEASR